MFIDDDGHVLLFLTKGSDGFRYSLSFWNEFGRAAETKNRDL